MKELTDADFIADMRGFADDHLPDGWPAVRMRNITRLCDIASTAIDDCAKWKAQALNINAGENSLIEQAYQQGYEQAREQAIEIVSCNSAEDADTMQIIHTIRAMKPE